jgi:hypothetical protein
MAKGGKLNAGHKIKYQGKDAKIVSQKGDMYFVEVMNYHPNGDSMFTVLRAEEIGKMAAGGYMADGGDILDLEDFYLFDENGKKYEFYKKEDDKYMFSSYKVPFGKAMTIEKSELKEKIKDGKYKVIADDVYMADGGYMAKGGIYSSDSLYILTVSKDGQVVAKEKIRARNMKEAREMGEDLEDGYKSQFGGDLSFNITEAMAAGGELHRTQEFKDGGSVFSEKELKEILDESLPHLFRGLNQIGLAMRYLEVKGQGGMKTALSNKLNIDGLNDSIEKIEQYVSK